MTTQANAATFLKNNAAGKTQERGGQFRSAPKRHDSGERHPGPGPQLKPRPWSPQRLEAHRRFTSKRGPIGSRPFFRARLDLDNSELIKLAIDELSRSRRPRGPLAN